MLVVLDWIAGSRVVVEGQSREFFLEFILQNCFGERGIRDLGSGLFWFSIELQLQFLDPPLDQLIEVLDISELLNPPPSLAVLSSRSKLR